jgi:hypothetical protein
MRSFYVSAAHALTVVADERRLHARSDGARSTQARHQYCVAASTRAFARGYHGRNDRVNAVAAHG